MPKKDENEKKKLEQAIQSALAKHNESRAKMFIEMAIDHSIDKLGPEETRKIVLSYLELIDEFYV